MPSDRFQRIEQLFAEAVEQPPGSRDRFLLGACGGDDRTYREVAELLEAAERSGAFLAAPALDAFARQIAREGWSVQPGDRVGSYTVLRRLGAGAMGEVWQAHDDRLGRDVAIKLLLPQAANEGEHLLAFEREARAAGALNHVNVLTVYDVGEHRGTPYLVTECLEGASLRARLGGGALPVDGALDIALQVASGLAAAHARGIVHRDLKPENVFLAADGRAKILDFGLATLRDSAPASAPARGEAGGRASDGGTQADTARSLTAGTAAYMAPEQVRGEAVDRPADIFALGVVLHEMLAGERPFNGASTPETLLAILRTEPPELAKSGRGVPAALSQVARRCLSKSAAERPGAEELVVVLGALQASRARRFSGVRGAFRRPLVRGAAAIAVLAISAAGWRWNVVAARARGVRAAAVQEGRQLVERGDMAEAYVLARRALEVAPDDPQLRQLWLDASVPVNLTTDPADAEVEIAPYRNPTTWLSLGRTPLEGVRVPRRLVRLRVTKAGFETIVGTGSPGALPRFHLDPVGTPPPAMVRVVGARDEVRFGPVGELDDYWIGRFEVTNREFKEFVDRGGYHRAEYWREPMAVDGRELPWGEAVNAFRDKTGKPGPSTWSDGTYPSGQAEFPVGGVSWYEAAAYAVFAGKSLPTMYHWYGAANLGRFADILKLSNFDGKGPSAVGAHDGLGAFGTFDMAGNLKEWCWNQTGDRRFILGGAFDEPMYAFEDFDARGPFDRQPDYGIRLAKYIGSVPPELMAPIAPEALGLGERHPATVDDAIFAFYRRQFAYDRTPLHAIVESTQETELGRKETVAFDAAYGGERIHAVLVLPAKGSPPYQTVVFFPAADAFQLRSLDDMSLSLGRFVVESGRALFYPVFKGTYDRPTADEMGFNAERELLIAWSRDLGRAIDYLETRSEIDSGKLAFYGVSSGADAGVVLTAFEPRLKASVIQGSGLSQHVSPELSLATYAPRVRVPTLMLNGRYDFVLPYATSQRPLFEMLGSPAADKRLAVVESGHALSVDEVSGEVLSWLDRYLGKIPP